jgi:hypothetical protein
MARSAPQRTGRDILQEAALPDMNNDYYTDHAQYIFKGWSPKIADWLRHLLYKGTFAVTMSPD